jgi:hypothetical protein
MKLVAGECVDFAPCHPQRPEPKDETPATMHAEVNCTVARLRIGSGLLAVPCERRAARGVALRRAAMGGSRGRGGGPPPPSPHRRDGVLTLQSIFRAMAEQHRGLVPAPTEEALRTLSGRHAAAQEHTEVLRRLRTLFIQYHRVC